MIADSPTLLRGLRDLIEQSGRDYQVVEALVAAQIVGTASISGFIEKAELLMIAGDAIIETNLQNLLMGERDAPPAIYIARSVDEARRAYEELPNILGALTWEAGDEEILAAIEAVSAGLMVVSPEIFVGMRSADVPHPKNSDDEIDEGAALTPREKEVLAMLADGFVNKEIAAELGISENTVKFHISSIYEKLQATNRVEALRRGVMKGYLSL